MDKQAIAARRAAMIETLNSVTPLRARHLFYPAACDAGVSDVDAPLGAFKGGIRCQMANASDPQVAAYWAYSQQMREGERDTLTVARLREILAPLPADMRVTVGALDAEFNEAGGVFCDASAEVTADMANASNDVVQIGGYADIREQSPAQCDACGILMCAACAAEGRES